MDTKFFLRGGGGESRGCFERRFWGSTLGLETGTPSRLMSPPAT